MDAFGAVKIDNLVPDFIIRFANLLKSKDEDNLYKIFSKDAVMKLYHSRLDKQAYTKQGPATIVNYIASNPLYFSESTLYYDSIDSFFDDKGNIVIVATGLLTFKNNNLLAILDTFYLKNWAFSQKNAGWALFCFQRRHLCPEDFRPEAFKKNDLAREAPIQFTPEAKNELASFDTIYYDLAIHDFIQSEEFEEDLKARIAPAKYLSARVVLDREGKRRLMIKVKKGEAEEVVNKISGFKIRDFELKNYQINPKNSARNWKKSEKKNLKK